MKLVAYHDPKDLGGAFRRSIGSGGLDWLDSRILRAEVSRLACLL